MQQTIFVNDQPNLNPYSENLYTSFNVLIIIFKLPGTISWSVSIIYCDWLTSLMKFIQILLQMLVAEIAVYKLIVVLECMLNNSGINFCKLHEWIIYHDTYL